MRPDQSRNLAIDGLRGLAVLWVICVHTSHSPRLGYASPSTRSLLEQGLLFVPIFFCLSGYLINHSLVAKSRNGPYPAFSFYLLRFFRILPLWWLILAIACAWNGYSLSVFLLNASFLFGFVRFDPGLEPVIGAWSLFVEEVFYLCFPWLFSRLKRTRNVWIGFAACVVIARFWKAWAHSLGVPDTNSFVELSPLANFQYFFLGVAFDHALARGTLARAPGEGARRKPHLSRLGHLSHWWDALAVICFLGGGFGLPIPDELAVTAVVAASLGEGTWLNRLFRGRLFRYAGVHCYFLYLAHMSVDQLLVLFLLRPLDLANRSAEWRLLHWCPLVIALCLALSWISARAYEEPFLRLGRRLAAIPLPLT